MPIERVSDPADPRLDDYRRIADGELMRDRGLFVAEGRLVVRRVIESDRFQIRSLLVSDAARESLGALIERVAPRSPVLICDAAAFLPITGFNIHRGCLALVERPVPLPLDPLLASARRLVVLEAVANPDNVGAVFRNVAALGADGVLISPPTCDPLYRKAVRTSMAAVFRVPYVRLDSWPDDLNLLREAGFTIAAMTPNPPAVSIAEFVRARQGERIALLVGAEGAGLSAAAEAHAHHRVRIPIRDDVDSLNLAMAVGIGLYALASDPQSS